MLPLWDVITVARPLKSGIDYYPLDVGFLQDLKIRKIMRACGPQSIAVLISLLGNIYNDEGYYMMWDEDVRFLISDEVGVKESLVQEVIYKAINVNFFSRSLFEKYKILTSIGIQKRYKEITSRRRDNSLKKEYSLINDNNNKVNDSNNSINVDKSTQRKEKESKVKESKEDTITDAVIFEYKKQFPSDWVDEAVSICLSKNKGNSYLEGILKNFKIERNNNSKNKKSKFHNFKSHSEEYTAEELDRIAREQTKRRNEQI